MNPKYNPENILYYVNPMIFTIDSVMVSHCFRENEMIYYIDNDTGAYLAETDLFDNLDEAIFHAIKYLEKFYLHRRREIETSNPEYNSMEDFQDGI